MIKKESDINIESSCKEIVAGLKPAGKEWRPTYKEAFAGDEFSNMSTRDMERTIYEILVDNGEDESDALEIVENMSTYDMEQYLRSSREASVKKAAGFASPVEECKVRIKDLIASTRNGYVPHDFLYEQMRIVSMPREIVNQALDQLIDSGEVVNHSTGNSPKYFLASVKISTVVERSDGYCRTVA